MLGSLRAKFALTAAAGLLVAIVMTVLLIVVAQRSQKIVNAAEDTQQRIAILLNLQNKLDRFQSEALIDIRESAIDPARLQTARDEFIAAANGLRAPLQASSGLPAETAEQLYQQAMRVLQLFDRRRALGRQIDNIWEQYANQQALSRIRQIYAGFYEDYYKLRTLIHNQIPLENQALRDAVERAQALQNATTPTALLCLILALLGYGVVLSLVWGRLSPALRKLEISARAVGAGEMGRPIDLDGNDELSRVSQAFDYMAEQLSQKQQSLQQLAVRQEAAVAERTQELENANQALAAADQQRRAFLADISHELRTPLTIIRGEAQMALRSGDESAVDPVETLERILSQTRSLSRLVDDLFLIARAEAGGLILHESELDIASLTSRVAKDISGIAQDLGVSVSVHADTEVQAVADADRVRQVLIGLIDNALRHARAPSGLPALEITLSAWEEDASACVSVSDNGPGFSPDILGELFVRFRRGGSGAEGSGLGLTVVRALIEAMGGSVELSNRAEGGAAITMRLRRVARENPQDVQREGKNADAVPAAG
jgi:signal transduction histidine kinase